MFPNYVFMWFTSGGEPFDRSVVFTKTWRHESSTIVTIPVTIVYDKAHSCSFRTKVIIRTKTSGGDTRAYEQWFVGGKHMPGKVEVIHHNGYYVGQEFSDYNRLSLSYGGNWEPTYSSRVCSLKTVGIPGYDKGFVYDHGDSRFPYDHRYNRLSGGAHIAALQYQSPARMISISNHPWNPGIPGDIYGNSNVNCNDSQTTKARLSFTEVLQTSQDEV